MSWAGFELEKAYRVGTPKSERVSDRQDNRWTAQEHVRALLQADARWLIHGTAAPPDASAVVDGLLKKIDALLDNEDRRLARNFFAKGIASGVEAKLWSLSVPHQTLRTKLPTPPITSMNFIEIRRIFGLRSAFFESLRDPQFLQKAKTRHQRKNAGGAPEIDLRVGRVLLSMIIFGGMAKKKSLILMARLGSGALACHAGALWMEWEKENEQDDDPGSWRRWYPEQVSGLLAAAAHADGLFPLVDMSCNENDHEKAVWRQIKAVLKLLPIDKFDRPKSLAQLIRWTKTWLYYKVPPVLAHFACGSDSYASLPPGAHIRVITGQKEALAATTASVNPPVSAQTAPICTAPICRLATTEEQATLRRDLRAIFSSSKRKRTKAVLLEIEVFLQRSNLPASFVRLAQWTKSLVMPNKSGGKKLRNSSISSYLLRVDKRIAIILEDRDPAFFDESELEELYTEVISGLPDRSIGPAIISLRKFHQFLVSEFGVPDEVGDVLDGYASGSSIDANVLSLNDYRLAWKRLQSSDTGQPVWLAKMQTVALMLGYRALLRRGEVHRLRMKDVLPKVIYVRSTAAGSVKSHSSIRNILFDGNLPAEEEDALMEFINARWQQLTGLDEKALLDAPATTLRKFLETPLFQEPRARDSNDAISVAVLFKQISTTLHEVTGNALTHFHLARKGGINWKLISIFEAELPGCSLFFDPSGDAQNASQDLNRALMGSNTGDRRKLWAISCLAGHANPSTTLGSYITCLDWLLSYALRRDAPLPDAIVAAVTGVSEGAIRSQRSRKNIDKNDYLPLMKDGWLQKVRIGRAVETKTSSEAPVPLSESSFESQLRGHDILTLLNQAVTGQREIGKLAHDYQILVSTIELWLENIKILEKTSSQEEGEPQRWPRLPALPIQLDERRRLNQLTDLLTKFTKSDPDAAKDWLKQFFLNYSERKNAVVFYDVQKAFNFFNVLQALISGTDLEIGVSLSPLVKSGSIEVNSQISFWLSALQLEMNKITVESNIGRQSDADMCGKLSFYLKSESNNENDNFDSNKQSHIARKIWTKKRSGSLAAAAYVARIGLCNPI